MQKKKERKEMPKGIYKRGGIFWIRYAGIDGKTIFESTRTGERSGTKLKEAEDLLHERKAEVLKGKQPEKKKPIPNVLFKNFVPEYLKWAKRQRAYKQKSTLVNQLKEIFGNYPLRAFNGRLLEQYQTERLEKGNKPGTVNRHITVIKHMMSKAVEWEMVEEEVSKRVHKVKMLEENNRRLRYLSSEECQKLIEVCGKNTRPIVIMALNTGMRRGEILSLRWDNVDLRHGFILLEKTKNGDRREIPINTTLRTTLEALPRRLDGGPVFFNPETDKAYGDIKTGFNNACKRAKIKDFHFHDLRHTFASHLVMAGVDITTVKELLGHKTLTMTLRYAHLAPSHKVKAVDILDSTLSKSPNYTKTVQSSGEGE